jgi:gamma-glutamyl phosphate reductase
MPLMTRRFLQNPAVETAPLNEERILFDSKTNRFAVLNDTSTFLWDQLAVPRTLDELAEELHQTFQIEQITEARRDVERALQELQSLEFVIPEDA